MERFSGVYLGSMLSAAAMPPTALQRWRGPS